MELKRRINAFVRLGEMLRQGGKGENFSGLPREWQTLTESLHDSIRLASENNPWFDEAHIQEALSAIAGMLKEEALVEWASGYRLDSDRPGKRVALIMAGNIPAVGFHDFLCVLVAGHSLIIKPSHEDRFLIPWMADFLKRVEPDFRDRIFISEGPLRGFDAVIATGSDNSARYFETYFGKYPSIIRRNMNSIAFLDGTESENELLCLSKDIMLYYGRGCRSVSCLLLPTQYKFEPLEKALEKYRHMEYHHRYYNNYEYQKAIHWVGRIPFRDNGFLLMTENEQLQSPLGVLHYTYYNHPEDVDRFLEKNESRIQCLLSVPGKRKGAVPLGSAHSPGLDDYADRVDTMRFLTEL